MNDVTPSTAVPAEIKSRTITLTNRAPVRISEEDWPIIGQGVYGYEQEGAPYSWTVEIRLRQHVKKGWPSGYIIHANYDFWDDMSENGQRVRVGRYVSAHEAVLSGLDSHILATGDELRERILDEGHRKQVLFAIDNCFASLKPQSVFT